MNKDMKINKQIRSTTSNKNSILDSKDKNSKKLDSKKLSSNLNLILRLKAFLTDIFLINMPILYITTYVVLDGKDNFLNNQLAIGICVFLYCFILFLFLNFSAQTPGFRYAQIALASNDDNKLKVSQVILFIILWIIEIAFVLPIIIYFTRKDRRSFHELISNTKIIYKENTKR